MLVADFDYELPEELIAQHPPAERGASRMMTLDKRTGAFADRMFRELPELLRPGDVLVMNDSRVIPARLFGRRAGLRTQAGSPAPEGVVEVLLTARSEDATWTALVKPAKKVGVGETLVFAASDGEVTLRAEVVGAGEFGERTLRFEQTGTEFFQALERVGHMPLPPYIRREKNAADMPEDRERYQTVYARSVDDERGSAAAPTAGLHFTAEMLERLRARGVELRHVTLHVGLGTFRPVRVERVEDVRLHEEPYTLPAETAEAIHHAKAQRRRVIAVGTTTTRTLEHAAREARGGTLQPHAGATSLFLSPGAEFKVVDGLLTNFHLPQSTLLMLVSALAGREPVLAAYRHAVEERYRFFSYGDCMLVL